MTHLASSGVARATPSGPSVRLADVDRRGFLLGTTALIAAGCARVPPAAEPRPAAVAGGSPTPSSSVPPLSIGSDATPTGRMLAQLLVGALAAKGRDAKAADAGKDWQAALGHGDLSALPAFGGTVWSALSQDDEPPAADQLLGQLATLVAPEIGVLDMRGVDGTLVWMVAAATARAGITSLARIGSWSRGRTAVVPPLAVSRADGVPGLRTVYGAKFAVTQVEDPVQRAARLTAGQAAIGAFRRTEYTGASGLVELVDVEKIAVLDPGVVLVNKALTDAEPDHVLAINVVAQALTTAALVELQAQVAAGGSVTDVAGRWLKEQGLA